MKSRIISLVIFAVCMMPHWAKAQITASNPLEWMALAEGWKIQCKMPPKTKKILPPENIQ